MYYEILDDKRISLLNQLNTLSFISKFSLGEGTALSLQMKLRKSIDFVFYNRKI